MNISIKDPRKTQSKNYKTPKNQNGEGMYGSTVCGDS